MKLRIDAAASRISLEGARLGPLKQRCQFTDFHGAISMTRERRLNHAELHIAAGSLRSAFGRALDRAAARVLLQADRHPWVTVTARSVVMRGDGGELLAELRLRGRSRPVPLHVCVDDVRPDGSVRFTVAGAIDRRDFGVAEDLPGFRLGNQISIRAAIHAVPA